MRSILLVRAFTNLDSYQMPITLIQGPVIAGLPNGYPRYWTTRITRSTIKRKKPTDVLRNPTAYTASKFTTNTEADFVGSVIASPYYGAVAVDPSGLAAYNSLVNVLSSQSDGRLLSKIKNEKWNIGTFLGELPETQRYLRGVIPRIVGIYTAFKRRAKDPKYWRSLVRRGKRFLKKRKLRGSHKGSGDMAGLWLEFRYAVSPLAYDAQDMLNYFHDSALNMPVFRAASGATDNLHILTKTVGGPTKTILVRVQVRTACYYSAKAESNALKRLGLINLPAVLWELTPLSFVVDMVLPVGDFIGNFDAMVGVTVLSCTRSTRSNTEEVRSGYRSSAVGRYYGGSHGRRDTYQRSVIAAPVNKPIFSKSATGRQLCDIVALMRTIVFKP